MRLWSKYVLQNLVVTMSALTLVFAVIEVSLRKSGYNPLAKFLNGREVLLRPSSASNLQYELTPLAKGWAFETDVEINSSGFRGREYSLLRNSKYRILALGDSTTFANWLTPEDS